MRVLSTIVQSAEPREAGKGRTWRTTFRTRRAPEASRTRISATSAPYRYRRARDFDPFPAKGIQNTFHHCQITAQQRDEPGHDDIGAIAGRGGGLEDVLQPIEHVEANRAATYNAKSACGDESRRQSSVVS